MARDHNQAACFLDNKNATWLVSLSIGCFFFKKKGGGPLSKKRPTPLFFKKNSYGQRLKSAQCQLGPPPFFFKKKHPMDRETNQVAFLLSKKHAAWLGSLPIGFYRKKNKRPTSKNGFRQPKIWCAVVLSLHRHQI